ncbi:hypothetical protein GCM10007862_15750 [Dyella lipolytica]|uniref:Uncharacterized protein n=1 Tax=Dyella lipolytica TaxID=1867835 RepID=A0ABW8IWA8_9GAMM|nr:hypothetical protein [Dyella lipolytica]GLQ46524.1 hypothetical protein GCM10007862_15750 [Dyella lipolytica]
MKWKVGLFLLMALYSCQISARDTIALNVGGGDTIVVPVIADLLPLGNNAAAYRQYLEYEEIPGRRLLETFMSKGDLDAAAAGIKRFRGRTLTVDMLVTPSGTSVATLQQFQAAMAGFKAINQDMLNAQFDAQKVQLASKLKQSKASAYAPKFLGLIVSQPRAVAIAEQMTIDDGTSAHYVAIAQGFIFVRERIIAFTIYKEIQDQSDTEWVKRTGTDWAAQVLKLNPDH